MSRTALIAIIVLAGTAAHAADHAPPARDFGRLSRPTGSYGGAPLHRDSLLGEIEGGQRKLFAHDPHAASPDDPKNQFLVVRDRYVSPGSEHALGILTPPGRDQPAHIREVTHADAPHLGRMIRSLMFADRKSEHAPKGGYAEWNLYVNMYPAVPRLHIHAQPGGASRDKITDWNAFAQGNGYKLHKTSASYKVWTWTGKNRAPNGWNVLAVGDAKLGPQASLATLSGTAAAKVDKVIGDVWIEAAALATGSQIETTRSDTQIVARSAGN